MLHQIHPLSGQGFNMTLRDLKVLLNLIRYRESLGLPFDSSIFKQFENKTKHLNFIFSFGNDFIYEFFNYDNFYLRPFSKKIFKLLKTQNKKIIKIKDGDHSLSRKRDLKRICSELKKMIVNIA